MQGKKVITRFAPSPTGYMHIGNLRTALYSYLISKHNNGDFILRIEDTDRERFVEGAVDVILETMEATGLIYDEGPDVGGCHGPYIQSERKNIYIEYAEKLVEMGGAYYCFCSKERLDELHEEDPLGGYDRHCRDLPKDTVDELLSKGLPYVIRQKMPLNGTTSYYDSVFGEISFDNTELQDQVLIKGDGYPTYNFCHVIDDHLMEISHVVRGCEYLTSTPGYVQLYDAFGWERPVYVHLPLLMGKNEDGTISKLSKRHGAVSFKDLVDDGYLPEAIINYIAFLGWCPKETNDEIFGLEELIKLFSIEAINNAPAVFDYNKLAWFNNEYIRKLPFDAFYKKAIEFIKQELPDTINKNAMLLLIQSRINKFCDIDLLISFFCNQPEYDVSLFVNKKNKVTTENSLYMLQVVLPVIENLYIWDNDSIYTAMLSVAEKYDFKKGAVMWCVRIAVSGLEITPGGATEIMTVIGKTESIYRIKKAIDKLSFLNLNIASDTNSI